MLASNRFAAYDGRISHRRGWRQGLPGRHRQRAEIGEAVSHHGLQRTGRGRGCHRRALGKVGTDGKAITGTAADHQAAPGAATQVGQLIEVQLYKHVHA